MTNVSNRRIVLSLSILIAVCTTQSCTQADKSAVAPLGATSKSESKQRDDVASSATSALIVPVQSDMLRQEIDLPAELQPYRDVKVHAKVKGFVSWIGVDRGSIVKAGQCLIKLSAPELDSQCNELAAKVTAAQAAHAEALSTLEGDRAGYVEIKAKLDSDLLTLQRLRKAALEPGAIALNEIDQAQKTVEGDEARLKAGAAKIAAGQSVVAAKQQSTKAAESSLKALQDTRNYLVVKAPMDGVITERWVHEGDMAGVEMSRAEDARPLLRLVQTSRLRLIVAVPESQVAGIREGEALSFTVPAFQGLEFKGVVSRIGHALDVRTRTMPVELDVRNEKGDLEPGMYAAVKWQVKRPYPSLFVPASAVVSTIERTFVVRVKDGLVSIVKVKPGQVMGNRIEIFGPVALGDQVMLKGSDEYKAGAHVSTRMATEKDVLAAGEHRALASGE